MIYFAPNHKRLTGVVTSYTILVQRGLVKGRDSHVYDIVLDNNTGQTAEHKASLAKVLANLLDNFPGQFGAIYRHNEHGIVPSQTVATTS